MLRKIIEINEEKCNGGGACADACHEGAIAMAGGKARLIRDDYCDGLGDCLPACPTNAITFTMREAAAYDEQAVIEHKRAKENAVQEEEMFKERPRCLSHWPVQIKLAPFQAPHYAGQDLLIAADCTAYAYAGFHEKFMKGCLTMIGCPKLDSIDYSEKLTEMFRNNEFKSIKVVRMQVPCCGGMAYAVKKAIEASGKNIPLEVITLTLKGQIME